MLKRLRAHLTYANAMATVAVFLALGGGIAWALATNSVKSKHIKDGQVKFSDLNDAAQPIGFEYSASTGDDVQEEVLHVGGYRITAECENVGGKPSLGFFLEFPEDGRILGSTVVTPSNGPSSSSAGAGLDVTAGVPTSGGGAATPSAGEQVAAATTVDYTGQTLAAALNIHLLADDDDDACRLSGTLIPGELQAQ